MFRYNHANLSFNISLNFIPITDKSISKIHYRFSENSARRVVTSDKNVEELMLKKQYGDGCQ